MITLQRKNERISWRRKCGGQFAADIFKENYNKQEMAKRVELLKKKK
jgi:hypothetical protein